MRKERPYYGVSLDFITKISFDEIVQSIMSSKSIIPKNIRKNKVEVEKYIKTNFANRLIAVVEKTDEGPTKINIKLLSRDWSGDEIKNANVQYKKSNGRSRYVEFDSALTVVSMTTDKPGVKWLVSKAEELGAETSALGHIQTLFDAATEGGKKGIKVSIEGVIFNNVGGIKKNEAKTAHSDFILTDTSNEMIAGSGISHKVQKRNLPPQTYAAVTRLIQNIQNIQKSEPVDESQKKLIEFTQNFINTSIQLYKNMLIAGETTYVSGWHVEIIDPEIAEVFIYGPRGNEKDECAFIIISDIDGMTLKPLMINKKLVPNTYVLDAGKSGHLYKRDSDDKIPSDSSHKPILMFRPGTGGSIAKIPLTEEQVSLIKLVEDAIPDAVVLEANSLKIQYKVHAGPKAKAPGGAAAPTLENVQNAVKARQPSARGRAVDRRH
jgi:hypothetical protein